MSLHIQSPWGHRQMEQHRGNVCTGTCQKLWPKEACDRWSREAEGPTQSHLVQAPRCLRDSLPPSLPVPCGHTALLTGQPLLQLPLQAPRAFPKDAFQLPEGLSTSYLPPPGGGPDAWPATHTRAWSMATSLLRAAGRGKALGSARTSFGSQRLLLVGVGP